MAIGHQKLYFSTSTALSWDSSAKRLGSSSYLPMTLIVEAEHVRVGLGAIKVAFEVQFHHSRGTFTTCTTLTPRNKTISKRYATSRSSLYWERLSKLT